MEIYRKAEITGNEAINESALADSFHRALGIKEARSAQSKTGKPSEKECDTAIVAPTSLVSTATPVAISSVTASTSSASRELISYADLFDNDTEQPKKASDQAKPKKKKDANGTHKKGSEVAQSSGSSGSIAARLDKSERSVAFENGSSNLAWKVGDFCLATFTEDDETYPAKIIWIDEKSQSCIVHYLGYDNEEEQPLIALRKINDRDNSENSLSEAPAALDSTSRHSAESIATPTSQWTGTGAPLGLPECFSESPEQQAAFGKMLNAWYTAGYETGYYLGLQHAAEKARRSHVNQN